MANGKYQKVSKNEGYLSDESDFYGDPTTQESFEHRAAELNDTAYWISHQSSLTEKADASVAQALANPPPTVTRYNPYEGQVCAWQLDETVDAFLQRLPPRTTQLSETIPWIYITNPFQKAPKSIAVNDEAPPCEDGDWGRCVTEGNRLLEELTTIRNTIEKQNAGKSTIAINRLINPQKEVIVQKILDMAIDCRCTSGKWMIFSPPSSVNELWTAIAQETVTNSLGIAAKVAPDNGSAVLRELRLICIYTENFADKMDVYRVMKALQKLGLVDKTKSGTIYYKADVYTYLQLDSNNPYNIKASLYNSLEFLKNPPTGAMKSRPIKKENGKVDAFFKKFKKEPSDLAMRQWDWE